MTSNSVQPAASRAAGTAWSPPRQTHRLPEPKEVTLVGSKEQERGLHAPRQPGDLTDRPPRTQQENSTMSTRAQATKRARLLVPPTLLSDAHLSDILGGLQLRRAARRWAARRWAAVASAFSFQAGALQCHTGVFDASVLLAADVWALSCAPNAESRYAAQVQNIPIIMLVRLYATTF